MPPRGNCGCYEWGTPFICYRPPIVMCVPHSSCVPTPFPTSHPLMCLDHPSLTMCVAHPSCVHTSHLIPHIPPTHVSSPHLILASYQAVPGSQKGGQKREPGRERWYTLSAHVPEIQQQQSSLCLLCDKFFGL